MYLRIEPKYFDKQYKEFRENKKEKKIHLIEVLRP